MAPQPIVRLRLSVLLLTRAAFFCHPDVSKAQRKDLDRWHATSARDGHPLPVSPSEAAEPRDLRAAPCLPMRSFLSNISFFRAAFVLWTQGFACTPNRTRLEKERDLGKTQKERNRLGQFATPTLLASDLLAHAHTLLPDRSRVRFLDPAIGTGAFYTALVRHFPEVAWRDRHSNHSLF
jgi:hypothetical protein